MNVRLCAQCVGKRLLDSMIENGMKGCTLGRRSLFVVVSSDHSLASIGDVIDVSPVRMHWGDISGRKLAGFVSSRSWMKKLQSDATSK